MQSAIKQKEQRMDIEKIRDCRDKHKNRLFKKANVISVGLGYKVKGKEKTSELCLVVGVTKKVDRRSVSRHDLIPDELDGVKLDVVEVGYFKSLASEDLDPTQKHRPSPSGVSISHKNTAIGTGTFGCIVKKNGERFILSNNHILAASNDARIGDAIYQPGTHDGGTLNDQIGILDDFISISFNNTGGVIMGSPTCIVAKAAAIVANIFAKLLGRKHRLMAVNPKPAINYADCALARPINDGDILNDIIQIGAPVGVVSPALGMELKKYGRTSKYSTGTVLQVEATVRVSYGPNKMATFTDQIITGVLGKGGDSGSVALDLNNNLVGLLYAGSNITTVLSPMIKIFALLNISL